MNEFKRFTEIKSNIDNKTKQDLLKMHIKSILYLNENVLKRNKIKINDIGIFIQCSWYLNENQSNYIKVKLLEPMLTKNIKLCLDEVNSNGFFIASLNNMVFTLRGFP